MYGSTNDSVLGNGVVFETWQIFAFRGKFNCLNDHCSNTAWGIHVYKMPITRLIRNEQHWTHPSQWHTKEITTKPCWECWWIWGESWTSRKCRADCGKDQQPLMKFNTSNIVTGNIFFLPSDCPGSTIGFNVHIANPSRSESKRFSTVCVESRVLSFCTENGQHYYTHLKR